MKQQNLTLVFVTRNETLWQDAQAEGMAAENPFDHTELDNESKD